MKNLLASIKLIFTFILLSISPDIFAQLTGIKTIPGDYATVSSAVTALNSSGVGVGGVTFNVAANYTETISATISITATGIASNPIVFQKDPLGVGANPLITAYTSGVGTPATAVQDGIWRMIGTDYLTIDGIDLKDNPANTTNPSTMEYGYGLYKASTSNGCQYVTIKNCVITLNNINNATGTAPMVDGSTGIVVMNALSTAATTLVTPIAGGTNSNNKFYSNTIQNCNTGIALIGYAAASPFTLADTNNDMGGSSSSTGNIIVNYGGAAGATNAAAAIRTLAQYGLNVSYNTLNNNNGSGTNHPNALRGIYINTALSANTTVTYNTITLNGGGTIQAVTGIENVSGSTAAGNTVNISNNTVTNSTYSTATTGGFYGIWNSATPATLTISNNTISNNSSAASTTGFLYGIYNSGAASTATINSNIFSGNSTATLTTGAFCGVYNSAAAANLSINSNTLVGNSSTSLSGLYYAILNSGVVTTTININSNNVGNGTTGAFTFNAINLGAQLFINNTGGAATAALSISNNNFQGVNYAVQGTGSNTYISNTAATLSQAMNSNTFTSLNVNTTGSITFIANSVIVSATGTQNVNSNSIVTSFNKAGAGGTVTLFTSAATCAAGSVINNNSNNFSNITVIGATIIAGWVNTDAGNSTKTIQNNTFSNWTGGTGAITAMSINLTGTNNSTTVNAINNISSAGTITGITTAAGNDKIYSNTINTLVSSGTLLTTVTGINVTAGTAKNIYQNTIYNLQGNTLTTGAVRGILISGGTTINAYQNTIYTLQANSLTTGTVSGIWVSAGTTIVAYGNKIYDLSSSSSVITGFVNGIQVSGAIANSTITIQNNLIGDLRTPSASSVDPIRGIGLISTGLTSAINVYNNTIYLNATSSGANFGSTGIYHTTSATATTATLDLRNNIVYNASVPNGTGLTVAYRRSSSTLTNYASTSNNNLFYAGLAAANRLLFYDGTNSDQFLSTYKPRVSSRDALSVTEDMITASKFLSTTGSSASFLHIDPTKSTQVESGGVSVVTVTIDFDGETRQGNTGYAGTGTAPDIGADEFDGIQATALSGTYNVGTGQTFTSLTNADGLFANINSRGFSGNVIVNITSDLAEDGTNPLYQWAEQGIGNYTLTIQPDALTVRIISGNVVAGMIRLNGADRVTIDGRYSGSGNYLTFRNTNTAGTTGTAFTFINGATNNKIKYCAIEGYANATNGVVLFSTSTVAGGNSNNLISYCNINATVSSNIGNVCIYSAGTIGKENFTNTISYNNIFNYRDRALDITATGSAGWTISGNSFYNGDATASINYASASTLHGIRILGGTGYLISNNYLGGNAASAGGTSASYTSTLGNVSYQGIVLTTSGASPASSIKGNIIANITLSSVPTVAGSIAFAGIETSGSGINIGGVSAGDGNIIGSNTVNSSISFITTTGTATFTTTIRGISCASTGGLVTGNQIGGIDIKNIGAAPAPSTFVGINISNATAPSQVNNNIIGSSGSGSTSNSIQVLSTSTSTKTAITGIAIASTVISVVQVDGNIIQNLSHLGTATTLTSGGVIGISNASTGASAITITNNTVTLLSFPTYTTGVFYGIYNSGACSSISINTNTINGNTTSSTTGVYYAIYNSGAVTSAININSNNIGNSTTGAFTFTAANSGTQVLINNTGGAATTALSISNNNFQGIIYSVTGTGVSTYISNTAATLSQTINGNTFTSLSIKTNTSITFISNSVILSATGTQNVNNNSIVTSFNKTVAGGTVTLFTTAATSVAGSVTNNNSNNFSNINVTGATIIAGWVNTDADAGTFTKNIQNNTFSNWTGGTSAITAISVNLTGTGNATTGNLINNISCACTITGITTAAGNDNIYSNTINTLSTTGAFAVNGIAVTAGTTKNIYKNKIYDLSASNASSTVNGVLVSGGTTVNVYNNLIGDLRATAASAADPIRGISVTSVTASSTINVYFNTVYLNASSTGANFGTTGIYHTTSATATTATLNLRNNSITNTSSIKGTGLTVAYRRSSTTLTNYAVTSNNNLFYAGTPGATKLIFYDGTNSDQTIAAFITRMATRDALSTTENLTSKFLSTTGSSAVFLHMDASQSSLIESGAVNIAGFTDDVDAQIRAGNTGYTGASSSPDIGADEIFGIETVPPTITYTLLANTTSTANRNVSGISITDASGINITAGTKPRIYYKRSTNANAWLDNTSSTNGWKYTEATNSSSPFTFTIDYSLLYGGASVTAGVIQYFIVAQDIATTANIAINSGTFNTAPTSVALTSAAFPIGVTINSYSIPFSGTYNVGTTEIFTSLTKADGLFAAINSAGLMGNTTFNITSDLAEDGTNALNQWTESGVGNYTLIIQPDAATLRTISGNVAGGLIRFNGADRTKIDGSNSGSGTYFTFRNTNTAGTTGTAFIFINGATNDTLRYCNIEAYANATNGTILFNTSTVAGGNSNNLIDNCAINSTVSSNTGNVSVYSAGTVGNENSNNTISNNTIYNYRDRAIDITATGSTGWTISGNNIYNGSVTGTINYAASSTLHGIRMLGGSGYSILNNYIGGSAINASGSNAIYSSTSGNVSYQGISLTTTSASPVSNIKGNTVAAISVSPIPTSASSVTFTGIETNGAGINIGGSSAGEGNQIGSAGNNSSIIITTSTVSTANTSLIKGINCLSTGGSIIGNQVAGFDINNIGTAPASSSFIGININNASAPSQVINNIIGSSGTSNSIWVLSTSSATTTSLTGIGIGGSVNSDMLLNGNMIENISHLSLTSSGNFTGISNGASSGVLTISNDTIQNIITATNANSGATGYVGISSSSASSISNNIISNISQISSGTNAQITGINVSGAFAHTITGNFISGLTTGSAKASASVETDSPTGSAVIGILNTATVAGQIISYNTLYNINATNTSNINTVVTGIGITATISGNIFNNRIAGFTNKSTGTNPGICGITAANGSFNLYNNSIKIDNSAYVNSVKIYGIIHSAGSNWNYYHNSVKIGGNSTGTPLRSAAFIRPVDGSLFLRNNIFVNTRTGTGSNHAISNLVSPPSSTWSSSASNYNDLFSSNSNTLGEWGLSTNKTFAQWQTASGGEANSVSKSITFITSVYDLQPDTISNCAINNSGTPITTPVLINTDINNTSRSSTSPDMGAYEFSYIPFVASAGNNSPVCAASLVSLTVNPGFALNPTYSWTDPNNAIISTTQNPSVTALAGTYTVTVTDVNGCYITATTAISLTSRPTATLSGPTFVCSGNSAILSMSATGTGTISGSLNSGDIFSGTALTITVNVSPSSTTSYYITALTDGSCTSQASDHPDTARIRVTQDGEWTGVSNTNWNNSANWCGGVPTGTTDITIPAGLSNYPIINGVSSVHNVIISSGASLINNSSLQISGTISNSGTFNTTNGTIEMNGSTPQTIPANTFTNNTILNLIISNNVTLGGEDSLTGILSFGGSNLSFNTGGFLTLKSSNSNTARAEDITNNSTTSGNTILGNVKVERFISARRAWRFLTVPVSATGAQTINAAWQEGQTSGNVIPGYGTQITGGALANGFDQGVNFNPSLKIYNTGAWVGLPNTNATPITNQQGYMLFVRGDRSINLSQGISATPTTTVLRSIGTLKTNNQSFTVAATGFTVIGNPYAAPINLYNIAKANSTNIQDNFYLWDPAITGTNGVGGYVNVSWNGSSYDITPSSGGSGLNQYLQSGSAFLAKTIDGATSGTLVIKEADKSTTPSVVVNRPVNNTGGKLATNLYSKNSDGSVSIVDGVLNSYDSRYANSIDKYDAAKLKNVSENLSIQSNGQSLAVERKQMTGYADTIFYNLLQEKVKGYKFEFVAQSLDVNGLSGFLEDSYLNTSTPINLNGTTTYDFTIENIPGSWNPSRFRIVFRPAAVLPVTFSSVKAFEQNGNIKVEWNVENQINIKQFEIERSADGQQFEKANTVMPEGNNNSASGYGWLDETAFEGNNFYRIKSIGINGEIQYSSIVKAYIHIANNQIVIYPNPVINDVISMQFNNQPPGIYTVQLFNNSGQLFFTKKIMHTVGDNTETIPVDRSMSKGIYELQIIKPNKEKIKDKLFR